MKKKQKWTSWSVTMILIFGGVLLFLIKMPLSIITVASVLILCGVSFCDGTNEGSSRKILTQKGSVAEKYAIREKIKYETTASSSR